MSRLILFIFFILTVIPGLWGDAAELEEDVLFLRNLGKRDEGTKAEFEAIDYLIQRLDQVKVPHHRYSLENSSRGHSFSSSLEVIIPGKLPETIILAAPIDGGALGLGILLEMARNYALSPPHVTLVLLFLGAEKGEDDLHPYGTRSYLENFSLTERTALVYLDGDYATGFFHVRPGSQKAVTPSWLLRRTSSALALESLPFFLRGTDIQAARLGLEGFSTPLGLWLQAGIPAILLSGGETKQPVESPWLEQRRMDQLRQALDTLIQNPQSIPKSGENIYLYIRGFNRGAGNFIGEAPYIIGFIAIVGIFALLALINFRKIQLNLRRVGTGWWAWPLIAFLTFLFLFLGTLLIEEVSFLKDFPDAWEYEPGLFLFFKLTVTGILTLIFLLLLRGLPLPRTPRYWAYTAVITTMLNILISVILDVTTAFYFLWSLLFFALFAVSKKLLYKYIFSGMAVIPYFLVLAVILREPYKEILRFLILSRIPGNATLTMVILPALFALTSLNYWRPYYHRTRSSIVTPLATLILGISALSSLVWILNINPFGPKNPQPVKVVDFINITDEVRRIEVTSSLPLGNASLFLEGTEYSLSKLGRISQILTPVGRTPFSVGVSSRAFLERRNIRVTLYGEGNPSSIKLNLSASESFTLHNASWPFEVVPGGKEAELFIGRHPTLPLEIFLTVSRSALPTLQIQVEWEDPLAPPVLEREDLIPETRRVGFMEVDLVSLEEL